ncbi:GNAT family N-acetyltransferase [Plantactinospora sp. GCM10030261]|uniref:GNAT family N-acetyltransferase n=1 Tax=Plantactinospora sp. GCM10030261 TaxID=3273420 RepID=UPI00361AD9A9
MSSHADRYLVRPGRASDGAELSRLQAAVQLQPKTGGSPHSGIAAWVDGLMSGDHPSVKPDDFLVVEERSTGRPVASLVSLRQDWRLAGLRLPVTQVELVGTDPEHRGHRLAQRLFAALHERCAADGVPIQMIEGIPYFYRRLGYDYALSNGGASAVPAAALPAPEDRGMVVRPATVADATALARVDERVGDDGALVCPRDAAVWRHEIAGRASADLVRRQVTVLANGDEVRGYLVHGARLYAGGELAVFAAACERPADWPTATAAMYAYLGDAGRRYATADRPFTAIHPILDVDHPLARFGPAGVPRRARAWYVRTGDPIDLLGRLAPVLRARWAAAGLRWPVSELVIDTYGRAARLRFTDGELAAVTPAPGAADPSTDPGTHAAIPPDAVLQLALGYRTLAEVLDAWPDCLLRDRLTERFLAAAFPRVPNRLWTRT